MRTALLALLPAALLSLSAAAQEEAPAADTAPAPAPTVTYQLDPAKGLVYVKVLKDESTMMSGLSHNHVMQAKGWSGTVTWNADDPSVCKVDLRVPVAQLDVDPQWLRDRVGYSEKLKDSDRESIRKNMLAKDQLDAASYPEISFSSTRCTGAAGSYKVHGTMKLRGASAPITALMKIDADGQALSASGSFNTTHTAFGFQPFSALMGALKNRDELQFSVEVQGTAQ